jgi:hypothetical protein
MSQQGFRQGARRAALDAAARGRRERAERDKRLEAMAVRVLVAVRERDAAVAEAERRAGEALREMTDREGLSLREAVARCGGELTTREAARLRRAGTGPDRDSRDGAADDHRDPASTTGAGAGSDPAG